MDIQPEETIPDPDYDFTDFSGELDDQGNFCWGFDGVFGTNQNIETIIFMCEGMDVMDLWDDTVGREN